MALLKQQLDLLGQKNNFNSIIQSRQELHQAFVNTTEANRLSWWAQRQFNATPEIARVNLFQAALLRAEAHTNRLRAIELRIPGSLGGIRTTEPIQLRKNTNQ